MNQPRPKRLAWSVGDVVQTSDGIRWIIRALNRTTGRVALVSSNTTNHESWWNTTTDMLPGKNS